MELCETSEVLENPSVLDTPMEMCRANEVLENPPVPDTPLEMCRANEVRGNSSVPDMILTEVRLSILGDHSNKSSKQNQTVQAQAIGLSKSMFRLQKSSRKLFALIG